MKRFLVLLLLRRMQGKFIKRCHLIPVGTAVTIDKTEQMWSKCGKKGILAHNWEKYIVAAMMENSVVAPPKNESTASKVQAVHSQTALGLSVRPSPGN